jgi:sugar phosphate permease
VAVALGLLVYCVLFTPEERRIAVPGKEASAVPGGKIIGDEGYGERKTTVQLLLIPSVIEITLTVLCLKVVRYCMFLWLPMYLVSYLQYSVAHAGLFSTIFDIGASLGSPLMGIILDRYFKKNTLLGTWIFVVITTVSMGLFAATAKWGFIQNAIFMLVAGGTNGGTDSLLAGSVTMKIGEANGMRSGAAVTGLVNGIATLGAVAEGPLVGYIADNYGWGAVFTFMIILSAIASLMVFRAMIIQKRVDRGNLARLSHDKVPLMA